MDTSRLGPRTCQFRRSLSPRARSTCDTSGQSKRFSFVAGKMEQTPAASRPAQNDGKRGQTRQEQVTKARRLIGHLRLAGQAYASARIVFARDGTPSAQVPCQQLCLGMMEAPHCMGLVILRRLDHHMPTQGREHGTWRLRLLPIDL
jgi:hypothetical protein